MNITLYAIAKNEEKNIKKFIENSKKFSHVVVVDTGSTDNTVQLLRDAGIEVHEHPQTKEEFDFSVARNQALSYVKTDWAFSLDFNEKIDDYDPNNFDDVSDEITAFRHLRFDNHGGNNISQSDEIHIRIHKTKNYKWGNAVHEIPGFVSTENNQVENVIDTPVKITKQIRSSLSKELFYLSICEREHKKDSDNWYYTWFIFNHYSNIKNDKKALEYGQEFLSSSDAYFNTFRIDVFIKCSMILLGMGNVQSSANYAFHALSESMNIGEPHLTKAFSYLIELSKKLNNPNITIFATGFNSITANTRERKDAIFELYSNISK